MYTLNCWEEQSNFEVCKQEKYECAKPKEGSMADIEDDESSPRIKAGFLLSKKLY